jgi:tripartite-type tricarboxylate transporter receptor subunit TctC
MENNLELAYASRHTSKLKHATRLKRLINYAIGTIAVALAPAIVAAQNFPDKPVRIVVAQAPGSSADVVARILAKKLSEHWNNPVFVENKPGANGIIGMGAVATATPDGYTLGLAVPSVMTVNPFVYKDMPFKPMEDLVPVTQITSIEFGLFVNPELKVKTVADLIAYSKQKPEGLNYSSAGVGNLGHLAGELFASKTGIKMSHIPNKGDTPGLLDVMSGSTDMMFSPLPSALSHVRSGKLTLLAVPARKRTASFPDVPTLIESGLPDAITEGWTGIVAPAKTPPSVIAEIEKAVNSTLGDEEVTAAITSQGFEVAGTSSESFGQLMKADTLKWGQVIEQAGIKLNN